MTVEALTVAVVAEIDTRKPHSMSYSTISDSEILSREEFSKRLRLDPKFRAAVLAKDAINRGEVPPAMFDETVYDEEEFRKMTKAKVYDRAMADHEHRMRCEKLGYDPEKVGPEELGQHTWDVALDILESVRSRRSRALFHPAEIERMELEEEEREETEEERREIEGDWRGT